MRYEVSVENFGFFGIKKIGKTQNKPVDMGVNWGVSFRVAVLRPRKVTIFTPAEPSFLKVEKVSPNTFVLSQQIPIGRSAVAEFAENHLELDEVTGTGTTRFMGITGHSVVSIKRVG